MDQRKQVRFHLYGGRTWRDEGEMDARDVDSCRTTFDTPWRKSVNEERAENLHGRRLHLEFEVVPVTLSESESKDLLRDHGFPLCREILARSWDEVLESAKQIGFPVVLKANARDISHKSELGLVELGIANEDRLRMAHAALLQRLAGQPAEFIVAEMVKGNRELILGLVRDPDFGAFAVVGLGGVAAEALQDIQMIPLPSTSREIARALGKLRSHELFAEFRGQSALHIGDLERAIDALAVIAATRPEIESIDVNPMIVLPTGRLTAVDALVVLGAERQSRDRDASNDRTDRTASLASMFDPRAIVVLGASSHPGKFGFVSLHNIFVNGYQGDVYGLNQSGDQVLDAKIVTSLEQIPEAQVDLAFFCTPAQSNEQLLRQCAARGIKAAFVASAGYREVGEEGAEIERSLSDLATELGMVLGGPNGQGIVSTPANLCAQIVAPYPKAGSLSIASQSGNFVSSFLNLAKWAEVGVARAVSAGNSAHCDIADYLKYFSNDSHTGVSLAYVESITDGVRFMESVRAHAEIKPLVLIKGGRTSAGQQAASSHTGALASNFAAFESRATQCGAIVEEEPEAAFDTAAAFATLPIPAGSRLAVLTTVGGWGVVTSDAVQDLRHLEMVKLSDDLLARLDQFMPARWSRSNPLDCAGGETRDTVTTAIQTLCASGEVDIVLLLGIGIQGNQARMMSSGRYGEDQDLERIVAYHERQEARYVDAALEASREFGVTVALATELSVADAENSAIRRAREQAMYVFPTGPRAVRALDRMANYRQWRSEVR